jgi:hypothetical protein
LAEVLKARDTGGAPCHQVFQLAHDKLKKVSADIAALKQPELYLKKVTKDRKKRMHQARTKQLRQRDSHDNDSHAMLEMASSGC